MSSLLRPVVLEPCQTTLRGRRRSSHRALDAVPRLLSSIVPASSSNDSAISDEPISIPHDTAEGVYTPDSSKTVTPASLSPLSDAHVSDYFTSTAVGRHSSSAPVLYTLTPSPTETLARSIPSRKTSLASTEKDVSDRRSELERLKWRLTAGFFSYFLCGWGDGVTGTVLPYFTTAFHLNTMTSSLFFAGSTLGFFSGTLVVEPLMNFLGRCSSERPNNSLIPHVPWVSKCCTGKKVHGSRHSASQARHLVVVISSVLHACHFVMIGSKGGYAATFMAYAVAAFSRALLTASLNAYFASGPQQALGYSYGLWSLGGVLSPILCQTLISSSIPWVRFYFGSLVLSGINAALLYFAFKPTARENSREWREFTVETSKIVSPLSTPTDEDGKPTWQTTQVAPQSSTLRLALSLLYVWTISLLGMLYCGSETTTQGLMVTYLLGTRRANPKTVGYVTSGFWGGITIGRFTWGYLVPRLSFTQRKFTILGCLRSLHFAPRIVVPP
ncbi:hypothetical protein LshimejAT787_0306750 [Lyophyllum shimeji]|uniref:MFS general substrate transporter n=1 Tax=Lyophyllum shimeji TaxID=47721 RepID=A0A9P3UKH0_LYOSH|nr:hypothetical protein LshimejAT787_0306750 [Lyophyllum shimeji]